MRKTLVAAFTFAALAGCAHGKIPGTEIDDTSDTRAILDVMERYRTAVEAKDVQRIASLTDPSFKDDGGTPGPEDDLDYRTLSQRLSERFAKVDNLKLDLDIRKIKIQDDLAAAVYHYTTRFVVVGQTAKAAKSDSDIKQMVFKRVGNDWKITSGI